MSYEDTTTLDQNPEYNPNGPTTTRNAAGVSQTVYQLSVPLSPAQIQQIQSSVQGAGEGGGVTVSPDGKQLTIESSRMADHFWKTVLIAGSVLATIGISASLVGGSGAAQAASGGASTIGAGGSAAATGGGLASTTIGSGAVPGIAGGLSGSGMGAAAGGASLASKVASGLAGNSSLLKTALGVGAPLAAGALVNKGGTGNPTQPLDPALQSNFKDLLNMAMARQKSVDPVHQAAIAMATRMAPGYAQAAMGAPQGQPSASGSDETMQAIRRLLNPQQ